MSKCTTLFKFFSNFDITLNMSCFINKYKAKNEKFDENTP